VGKGCCLHAYLAVAHLPITSFYL